MTISRFLIFILLFINSLILSQEVKSIKLISPNGGNSIESGIRQGIVWQAQNIERINISYSIDNGVNWIPIYGNIAAELGVVSWQVPPLFNEHILVKVQDQNGIYHDISDYTFQVHENSSQSQSLQKFSQSNNTQIILPLGNSITYGVVDGSLDVSEKKGYRFPLYNLLTAAGINFEFTGSEISGNDYLPNGFAKNAGFPGISDGELADLLKTGRRVQSYHGIDEQVTPGPYLETYPADIILLHIGTNGNSQPSGTNEDDVEDILDEIKRFEDSTATEITVILSRIIDRVPNQSYVKEYNDNVETMVLNRRYNPSDDAYPDKIILVDLEDGAGLEYLVDFPGSIGNGIPGDMGDWLHPNDKGYDKMAAKWFTGINSTLSNCTDNSMSYWHFDEQNPSIFDDALGVNSGNCSDCPSSVNGMNNYGLFFDGNNQLAIQNNNTINSSLAGSFTIEGWIQTDQIGSDNNVFVGKYNGGSESAWWLGMNAVDSLAKFTVRSSNTSDIQTIESSSKIIDGKWHHIVGIKDHQNSKLRLYVDSQLEDEVSTSFTGNFLGNANLTFGAFINDFYFEGTLDEFALYDRALSENEILSNYQKGLIGQDYCTEETQKISITISLEGSFENGILKSSITEHSEFPLSQPYNNSISDYNGAEMVNSIPIPSLDVKVIDWVLVSLRSNTDKASEVARRAGFLLSDGSIVDLDGTSPLAFAVPSDSYYVVVEHRNHLPIMSNTKILLFP